MKNFAMITMLALLAILALFQQYGAMLASIILSAFYKIVVQSNKFPKLYKFFDEAF